LTMKSEAEHVDYYSHARLKIRVFLTKMRKNI
jgi:hypothetical protein